MADGTIRLDYYNAIAQANKLEEARTLCATQVNTLRGIATSLSECWQGNSGTAMIEKFNEWLEVETMQEVMLEAEIQRIKRVAGDIKKADEEAAKANGS